MRSIQLILLLTVALAACKKDTTKTDFREKYRGTYNVARKQTQQLHPSGGSTSTIDTITHETLTVSYKLSDIIIDKSDPSHLLTRPALMFRYDHDSMLVGVDESGKLFVAPSPNLTNYGGFIGGDSIFHAWKEQHTSTTELDTVKGRRK
ncbi:hypothetical protein [Polluticoccus soli]|uniref:hypothetical protein n=1 Tax=Polluticoccus soli TaxID=3034150 RepID=UPI0023E2E823|nr:hypothetical protein [Flavipsychrobacter sp. JY13-12]